MGCADPKYQCGSATLPATISEVDAGQIAHAKTRSITATIGGVQVVLQSRSRAFTIERRNENAKQSAFFLQTPDGPALCYQPLQTYSASVGEHYECVDSVLHYLDTRHGNAVVREVKETLDFSTASSATAAFKETWGTAYYNKLRINEVTILGTETWYLIRGGTKVVLSTAEYERQLYSESAPLILLYPNPPSLAIAQDPEVIQYGFYDYTAGEPGDWTMEEVDGGNDFYYPSWCREMGRMNQDMDKWEAADRFSAVFLNNGFIPATSPLSVPPVAMDGAFLGSMAVDRDGRYFASMLAGGNRYNFLTDGDPVQLTGLTGGNPVFYPVAPV